jgi:hypothetical protein
VQATRDKARRVKECEFGEREREREWTQIAERVKQSADRGGSEEVERGGGESRVFVSEGWRR